MRFPFLRRGRRLAKGQTSQLTIIDLSGDRQTIFVTDKVIEAPNWAPDGQWLVFNGGGRLYRLPASGGSPEEINTGRLADLNNDHVISPDGAVVYVSSDNGHLYAVPFTGGAPRQISNNHNTPHHHYLHGVSPDGKTLAYVAVEKPEGTRQVNVFTVPAAGGPDRRLTRLTVPCDGPEYSPDGRWIYFNSELAASVPGHMQIFRMNAADGSGMEQLTFDSRVNWFPHPAPDGRHVVYLSYPEGTLGHPPDKDVELRLMSAQGDDNRLLAKLFGGQGTMNVNSWSPDSTRLAFVSYPRPDRKMAR
jgi:TolB protein